MSKRSKKKRVLVIDSSVSIQKQINLMGAERDWDVFTAMDLTDASSKARSLIPDLIMVDASIGEEALKIFMESMRADSKAKSARFILLTKGSASYASLRPDGKLEKPFDNKALQKAVDLVLDEESTVVKTAPMETKLQSIAEEVVRESAQALENESLPESEKPNVQSGLQDSEIKGMAEKLLQEWIEKNMPSLAERIVKDEILKLTR